MSIAPLNESAMLTVTPMIDSLGNIVRNLATNLRANGPATVIIVWIVSMTILGLFGGDSEAAGHAMGVLSVAGGVIVISLAGRV